LTSSQETPKPFGKYIFCVQLRVYMYKEVMRNFKNKKLKQNLNYESKNG